VLLFDALVAALRGEELRIEVGPRGPVGTTDPEDRPQTTFGYEVM
jgi:hypothetical protein